MKPDDIPEDVWRAAGAVLGSPSGNIRATWAADMQVKIARAIMVERERSAMMAQTFPDWVRQAGGHIGDGRAWPALRKSTKHDIAAAIRKGE